MNNLETTIEETTWVAPELTVETWENTESMFDFFRCY